MLSYRHAFHAGNHADVLKHLILVHVLDHLNLKDKPWWYVDSHAGAGVYNLSSDYARKNAEYETGIGRLWARPDLPEAVARYVELVRGLNPDGRLRLYPGSPWIASRLMRRQDRLRLFELHPMDGRLLKQTFAELDQRVRIEAADGFEGLKAVLPPPSRRGLTLIDPAYEVKTDYRAVVQALKAGLDRFATGIYAIWYPLLPRHEARELPQRLRRLPGIRWLDVSLSVRAPAAEGFGMHGSGMFVVNPPWTLAATLAATLSWLTRILAQDATADYRLDVQAD
ncbi:MAG: 23S rRNA (adenine(2030)-N(6))-methyltransferase RlmJ [Thiobacillaceae bacterium]